MRAAPLPDWVVRIQDDTVRHARFEVGNPIRRDPPVPACASSMIRIGVVCLLSGYLWKAHFGKAGAAKPVGEGVSELRVDHGPGYRVYFIQRGEVLIVLLAGGNKSTQDSDIRNAKALAKDLKE